MWFDSFPDSLKLKDGSSYPLSHFEGNDAIYSHNDITESYIKATWIDTDALIAQTSWREDKNDDRIRHFDYEGNEE